MKATMTYKGYSVDLSDEVEGTNMGSYSILTPMGHTEPVIVECQNWQNLEKIAQRAVEQLILSKP
jgi:hypothetical protein